MSTLKVSENEFGYDVYLFGNWIASITRENSRWHLWGAFPDCNPFDTVGQAATAAADLTFAHSI